MVKAQAKPIFKLLLTLSVVFSCFCWAVEQTPQYDNLSFGVPGKADTWVIIKKVEKTSDQVILWSEVFIEGK